MKNLSANLEIGDAKSTTITNSTLGTITINPDQSVHGVKVTNSRISAVQCNNPSIITGLVGLSCPTR